MHTVQTEKAPAAIGPYSQAIQYGDLLFVSGQIPIDPKTGELVEVNTSDQRIQGLYAHQNRQRIERMRETFIRSGVDHFRVHTEEPYITALRAFFKQRERRR